MDTPPGTAVERAPRWTSEQRAILREASGAAGVRLVEATAGSGKSTVLVGVAVRHAACGRSSLFISLTNSVRHELCKNLREQLAAEGMGCEARHEAHHDYYEVDGATMHVATLDSWVHKCLAESGYELDAERPGVMVCPGDCQAGPEFHVDDYARKRRALLWELRRGNFPLGPLGQYDAFLLDEVQDLDETFMEIGVCIGESFARSGRSALFAGDMNQHIFGDASRSVMAEMRAQWASRGLDRDGRLFRHDLTVCFRCPPAHLRFVNSLFPDKRPTGWPDGKPGGERPILLAVPSGAGKAGQREQAVAVAGEIYEAIRDGYALRDIAVVAPYTRINGVFCHLESILSHKFCTATCDKLTWLYTDGEHVADWNRAVGKLALSSIHSNKGRTHRVVIVLGLTDGALPRLKGADSLHTDECLLFVALTRSNGRLVLVLEDDPGRMSYFIRRAFDGGRDLASHCVLRSASEGVLDWTWEKTPPARDPLPLPRSATVWAERIARVQNVLPSFVSHPRADGFSPPALGDGGDTLPDVLKHRNLLDIYGHFGALVFYRELRRLPRPLLAYKHAIHTPRRFIATTFRYQRGKVQHLLDTAGEPGRPLAEQISDLVTEACMAPPGAEDREEILRIAEQLVARPYAHVLSDRTALGHGVSTVLGSIADYERDCPLEELADNTMWSLALALGAMRGGAFDRPWLYSQLHRAVLTPELLPGLVDNARRAAQSIGHRVKSIETPAFHQSDRASIGGRIDLVMDDGSLLDIKCPVSETYPSSSWVQLLLYANMVPWEVPSVGVLDLSHGRCDAIDVDPALASSFASEARLYMLGLGYTT